jgi:hypothetical protein
MGAGIAHMDLGKISRGAAAANAKVSNVENVQASLLIDFAAAADGWNVINFGIGPTSEVTLLLVDIAAPYQMAPEYTGPRPSGQLPPAHYRIVQFGLGESGEVAPVATLDLGPTEAHVLSGDRLPDGRWLAVQYPSNNGYSTQVLRDDGGIDAQLTIGIIGPVQVTGDGRIWGGYGDESIFAGDDLTAGGIVCLDSTGEPLFRFNHDATGPGGAPSVWSVGGINVVSDDEVWVTYYADDPPEPNSDPEEYYALVKLRDYGVERVWPWRVVLEQAPAKPPDSFAVHGDRLLLQGSGFGLGDRPPTSDHPYGRLYSVPLGGGGATEMLPVDEDGNWIGPFRSEGRGSRLYLATWRGLRVVDLESVPSSDQTSA